MPVIPRSARYRIFRFLPILAAFPEAAAQKAPEPTAAVVESVTLSPFVLTVDSDVGYAATSTLAGSRLKTEFKDVASQVSVMTPEFLADIGAYNNDDAFAYSMNTETAAEIAGVTAQFFGEGGGGNSAISRTRGLGRTSTTRNFFKTDIPNDVYNTGDGGLTPASSRRNPSGSDRSDCTARSRASCVASVGEGRSRTNFPLRITGTNNGAPS